MDTWLVIGLGNPGPSYAGNRHNVGAMALEELAGRAVGGRAAFKAHKARARVAEMRLKVGGPKVVLATPSSYMNESGGAVAGLMKYYDVPVERVVVIHDELDIDAGLVRLTRMRTCQAPMAAGFAAVSPEAVFPGAGGMPVDADDAVVGAIASGMSDSSLRGLLPP